MTKFSTRTYALAVVALVAAGLASLSIVIAAYTNAHAQDGIQRAWRAVLCDTSVPHSQSLAQRNFILIHDVHTAPCGAPPRDGGRP